jgi:hypothetical protein
VEQTAENIHWKCSFQRVVFSGRMWYNDKKLK